jgi:NAD(P)-dependent dehydrogenase (short-subunit alcohol dehydrogenase family)
MTSVVIGGTSGIGRTIAELFAARGDSVVVTSRDATRAAQAAGEIGGATTGVAVDLASPHEIAERLADITDVQYLVLAAIERDANHAKTYDLDAALRLITLKLVGYTKAIHVLLPALRDDASIVLLGGLAKDRPYPGSTTVSTVNGGVIGLVHTLAIELAPIRVNALHPDVVGDSPTWSARSEALETIRARTPIGRVIDLADTADAVVFLLENRAVNGINLTLDGGARLT